MTRWMLPPDSVATRGAAAARRRSVCSLDLVGVSAHLAPVDAEAAAEAGQVGEGDVRGDVEAGHDRFLDRVLGHADHAGVARRRAGRAAERLAVDDAPARARRAQTEDRLVERELAVAGHAGDAHELAGPHREASRRRARARPLVPSTVTSCSCSAAAPSVRRGRALGGQRRAPAARPSPR